MTEENNVRVRLQRQPLYSERQEIKQKRRRTVLTAVLFLLALGAGFAGGYFFHEKTHITPVSTSDRLDEIKYYMENVWLFNNDYEDLDTELDDRAFYGMTSFEEDPYTVYMSASELEEFSSGINMNYVGIGVQYENTADTPTVTRVFKGSPAERAGIEVGDIIYKVDGTVVTGMDSSEIKERVIGIEGTKVLITVIRGGEEIDIRVIRGAIDNTAYAYAQNDYVVLELMSFGEGTSDEITRYLDDYRDYSKLIIDLRDDTGGYQTSVQEVAGLFLGPDVVVMDQIYNTGKTTSFKTISHDYFDNFKKIVILTNEETASAAEVLAICLKEQHPDTTLVGTTTYGKGVVQSTYLLDEGNSALKVTTSKWLSPNGIWVNGEGIHPDVEVFEDEIFYNYYLEMKDDESYDVDSVSYTTGYVQKGLRFLDYTVDRADGYFSQSTKDALLKFQKDNGLPETGILDKTTYQTVISKIVYARSKDPSKDYQMVKAIEIIGS